MTKYQKYIFGVIALAIVAIVICIFMPISRGLDIAGGIRVVLQADKERAEQAQTWTTDPQRLREMMQSARDTILGRVKGYQGVAEPRVVLQPPDRVVVELPGVKDSEAAVERIRSTASLEFYHLKDVETANNPTATWSMSHPSIKSEPYVFTGLKGETLESIKQAQEVLDKVVNYKQNKPIVTGKDLLATAKCSLDPQDGPVIDIEFNTEGTAAFREFTKKNVGEILAVFFDGKLLTAPTIRDVIASGKAQVSGFRSLTEAKEVADLLKSGALPVPLRIIAKDTVEPTLGLDTVKQVVIAGTLGLLLVIIFMLLYYRLPGLIANVALCLYALFTIAVFKLMHVSMSLAGVAALIISIGMAVDANILIFERLKEELKSGKTLRAAIDAGFSRAFTAIFDSNMCTAITCAILMWFGTPSVQSFAITLLIGVAISMFTAITCTRTILHLLVGWEWAQKPSLYGLTTGWMNKPGLNWDIVGKRNYFFALSGILIVPGLIVLATFGLKPGIEFKAGTEFTVNFTQPASLASVRNVIDPIAAKSEVQLAEAGKMAFIKTDWVRETMEGGEAGYNTKVNELRAAISSSLPVLVDATTSKPAISERSVEPTIGKELTRNAIIAVLAASIGIVLYLTLRFAIGGLSVGLKYGVCAVIALIHDACFILGLSAVLGRVLGWEVDSLFVTAILTVIGFSVHDTIVVFDRIRENLRHRVRGEGFDQLCNRSIMQTLSRSINTSLTVVLTLLMLTLFGGPLLRHFYIVLMVGIIVGTYSSIFNATPLVIVWEAMVAGASSPKRKAIEDKPLVEKPLVDTSNGLGPDPDDLLADETASDKATRAKRRPTARKRRF